MAKTKNKSPTDKKLPKKNSLKELINGLKKSPDNPKFSKKAADKYEKIQKLKKKYEKGGKENLKNLEKMKKEEKELNQIMKKYNIKQNNKKDKKGKDGKTKDKKKDKQSKKKKGKDGDKDKSDKKRDKKKGKGDKIKKSEKDETKGKNKDDKEKRKAERSHKRKESKEKRREARNRRREIRRKRREEREKRRTAKEEALLEYERNKKGFVPPDITDIEREAKRRNENQYANVDIEKQSLDEQRSKTIATVCIIFMCILASLLTADQMLDFFTCNEKPQSISDNSVGGTGGQISGPSYDQNVNNPDCCCGNNNYNGGNNNYGGNNNNGGSNGGNTNYVTGVGGNNNNGGTNNYGGTGGDTGTDQNYGYGGDSGTGTAGDSGTGTTGDSGTGTGGDAPGSDVDYGDLFTTTLASVITTTKQTVFTTPPFDPDMPFTLDVSILITEYQGGPVENDWMEEDTQKKLEWHSRLVVPLREMWGLMGVEKFITNFRMEKIYPSPGFYDSIATSTHITFDMQDELIGRLKWYGMPITQDYEYATQMSGLYEFLLMEVNLKGFPLYIGTSDTDWEGIVLDDVPTIRAPDLIPDTWQREPYKYK